MKKTPRKIKDAIWVYASKLNKYDNLNFEASEIFKNWIRAYGHLEVDGLFEVDAVFFEDSIEGEVQLYYSLSDFQVAHKDAVTALKKMYASWIDGDIDVVKNYPDYLPSFDEFINDFERIKP